MRRDFAAFCSRIVSVASLGFVLSVHYCVAQAQYQPSSGQGDSVKRFLQSYVGTSSADEIKTMRYFPAFVDLRDDGKKDVIVYLMGDGWCGSGGCTVLILAPRNSSYRIVAKIPITRPPIRVLGSKSQGWHDIAVRVQGGGVVRAYEAKLSFNGKTYARNSSVPPVQPLSEAGEVVVPITALTEGGKPLF